MNVTFLACIISLVGMAPNFSAQASSKKMAVGTVKEASGAPDVLRHPVLKVTAKLKSRAVREQFAITLYKKKYWEAYRVTKGMKLYYGDQLASGAKARLHIELNNGFEITLAPDTVVRISRGFLKNQNETTSEKWISLVAGKIRAKARGPKRERKTKFRTKTMAMGVRGTDFVVESRNGQSKVITIEGKVAVRVVSQKEHQLFETFSDPTATVDSSSLAQQGRQLAKMEENEPEVVLDRGMKIELPEPADRESMGMALTSPPPKTPLKLEPTPIVASDIKAVKSISGGLVTAEKTTDKANLTELEAEIEEPGSKEPLAMKPVFFAHQLSAAFTSSNIDIKREKREDSNLGGGTVSLRYQWFFSKHFFTGGLLVPFASLGGDAGLLINNSDKAEVKNRPSFFAVHIGGEYEFGSLGVGGALNLFLPAKLEVEYQQAGQAQTTKFDAKIGPMINLHLHYRFMQRYTALIELGGTGVELSADSQSENSNLQPKDEYGFSLFRLGVGYGF